MTRVYLIFPPFWPTEIPYLSLPALRSYLLRTVPDTQVECLDLNIRLWTQLRSHAYVNEIRSWLEELSASPERQMKMFHDSDWLRLGLGLIKTGQAAADFEWLSRLHGHELDRLVALWYHYNRIAPIINSNRHGTSQSYDFHDPFFQYISLSEQAQSAASILKVVENDSGNPYLSDLKDLFEKRFGSIVPDLVGISVVAINQVIPGMTLARWLKKRHPTTKVVLGGPWITHLVDRSTGLMPLFKYVDAMVLGEGERPLSMIVAQANNVKAWKDIPNVFTGTPDGLTPPPQIKRDLDLSDLPTPDLDEYDLSLYDYPYILPLQASRGCSWGRCTFCSYAILDPVYRTRPPVYVMNDIQALLRKHSISEIAFTDSLMEPRYFEKLSNMLIEKNIKLLWRGFGRFDRHFTRDVFNTMSAAGCHYIIWGMESGSDRILKLMQKGSSRKIISANLKAAAAAGIHNRTCIIYGYPSETIEDRDLTLSFLRKHKDVVHSIAFCPFTQIRGTKDGDRELAMEQCCRGEGELSIEVGSHKMDTSYMEDTEYRLRSLALEIDRHHTALRNS